MASGCIYYEVAGLVVLTSLLLVTFVCCLAVGLAFRHEVVVYVPVPAQDTKEQVGYSLLLARLAEVGILTLPRLALPATPG